MSAIALGEIKMYMRFLKFYCFKDQMITISNTSRSDLLVR